MFVTLWPHWAYEIMLIFLFHLDLQCLFITVYTTDRDITFLIAILTLRTLLNHLQMLNDMLIFQANSKKKCPICYL
jgi:hypothetical protein